MPDARLGELDMLDREEREVIGQLWNRSDSGYPATPLVHQRVAERARMAPDAVAVIFGRKSSPTPGWIAGPAAWPMR
ncbi:hypothetical protein P4220_00050 [Pseudomonas aeruginosa]|nr:hypothetical protein [Pseudomonas aeruginosa]